MAKSTYPSKPTLKSRRRSWPVYFLTFFISFCLLTAGVVLYIWKVNPDSARIIFDPRSSAGNLDGIKEFNILVAGLDEVEGIHRTDTIMIAHVSLKDKFANVVSVPRDLRVEIPGYRKDKINSAYAHGGRDLLIRTLEDFLDVDIDFYAILSLGAAENLIDAMGGVTIDVEKNMHYSDRAQNLYINLRKGEQHLDGATAMQYARFRYDTMGDFGRIERQQNLLRALATKATSYEIIKHLPRMAVELVKNRLIETNLTFRDMMILSKVHDDKFSRNINTYMLPGEPADINGISYVLPDVVETQYMVGGALRGGYHPRNKTLNIAVKNGCGSPQLARTYKRRLEYYGFEVLRTENAPDFDYKKTVVIVRRENPFSDAVAKLLDAEKVSDLQPDSLVHLEVILGRDKLQ